jgi:hypothetical protein
VQVTNCPSTGRDAMGYGDPINLGPGIYRPVFIGNTALGHKSTGTSELVIYLWTDMGFSITDFSKSVSSEGTSERSFQYVHMSQPGQILVFSRVSTSCGNASSSGVVSFERVSD